jgi:hypothetical protein
MAKNLTKAVMDMRTLSKFIMDKMDDGTISKNQGNEILDQFQVVLDQAGFLSPQELVKTATTGKFADDEVIRQGTHQMKKRLLELYPQLEAELPVKDARMH